MKNLIALAFVASVAACSDAPEVERHQQAVLTTCSGGPTPAGRCRLYSNTSKGGLCAELTGLSGEGLPNLFAVKWPGQNLSMAWDGDDVSSVECLVQAGAQKVQTIGIYDVQGYYWSGAAGGRYLDHRCPGNPPLRLDALTMSPASFRVKNWWSPNCVFIPF